MGIEVCERVFPRWEDVGHNVMRSLAVKPDDKTIFTRLWIDRYRGLRNWVGRHTREFIAIGRCAGCNRLTDRVMLWGSRAGRKATNFQTALTSTP
jgi:hypothetical protein